MVCTVFGSWVSRTMGPGDRRPAFVVGRLRDSNSKMAMSKRMEGLEGYGMRGKGNERRGRGEERGGVVVTCITCSKVPGGQ